MTFPKGIPIKMDTFFRTGFYLIENGEMTVNMYQGPVACQILEKNKNVCRATFNKKVTVVVEDVHQFPGHKTNYHEINSGKFPIANKGIFSSQLSSLKSDIEVLTAFTGLYF